MSIQAQTPDGVIHQFPDGTPDAVVDKAIKDYVSAKPQPAQRQESVYQKAARLTGEEWHAASDAYRQDGAKLMEKGAGANPLDMAKPVLDAARAALSPVKGIADATFGDKPVALPFGINSKGMTPGDIATFAIPVAAELKGAAAVSDFAKGAGLTARTGANTLAASRGVSAAPVAAPANNLAAKVAQFDKAQVRPSLATVGGDLTAGPAKVIAENPLAGIHTRANLRGAVQDVRDSTARIAGKYGEASNPQIAGENVQQSIKSFAQDSGNAQSFSAKAGALYDKAFNDLDAAMAGKTDRPAIHVVHDTDHGSITAQVGGSQIATPSTTAALGEMGQAQSKAIGALIKDPTVSKIGAALTDANAAKDMSFMDLRNLRTKVRLAQDNDQLRQDIGAANLQRLEGSLTQDIYANADKLGSPQLVHQLRRADQYYAAGQDRIQRALKPFADAADGGSSRSGENTFARVVGAGQSGGSADAQRLLSLKRSLGPDNTNDFTATLINHLGKPNPGAAGAAEDGAFSLANLVTNYSKLSPRGKGILFGSIGGGGAKATALQAELDNLVRVADSVKNVERAANGSKTMVAGQTLATGAGLLHSTIPTVAALVGAALTGEALTNPAVVRWVANLSKAEMASPAALSSTVGRLGAAAKATPALTPLYQASVKLLPAPAAKAAASDTNQGQ